MKYKFIPKIGAVVCFKHGGEPQIGVIGNMDQYPPEYIIFFRNNRRDSGKLLFQLNRSQELQFNDWCPCYLEELTSL
jgi:hypothetical protein